MQVDPIKPERPRCWLELPVKDERERIRKVGLSRNPNGADGYVKLDNLTPREVDAMEAFVSGASWVRCVDGRLEACDAHEAYPDPVADPLIGPHWKSNGDPKVYGGPPEGEGWHLPGIVISGVGSGSSHADGYERSANMLKECGFVCLRSQRGDDGRYWEQWVLHYMSAAKGRLAAHMTKCRDRTTGTINWLSEVEEAARYLTRDLRVAYGSLDITIQRWALSCDD